MPPSPTRTAEINHHYGRESFPDTSFTVSSTTLKRIVVEAYVNSLNLAPVPEPSSLVLAGTGVPLHESGRSR
jgi:hypothetical protein